MVVERDCKKNSESGQSVLEFMFMLPLMVGMIVILLRVNMAIQVSIVDQQYARSQALWLAFNNSVYPPLDRRTRLLTAIGFNQMVMGVSENKINEATGETQPIASTQTIVRVAKKAQEGPAKEEPEDLRAVVRVRDSVTLCTQSNVLGGGGQKEPLNPKNLALYAESGGASVFNYCGTPVKENE